ncbi:hypothetical protein DEO72_LG9g244 [Vigna unguiculata]|uniref:Uncharacterized protein n=1 Tax=Vigna unguiculata TaxID=3917 RepID=A0A4D6MX35_VIGUN|nr:hypothetical protein DEO72_LG9g244 [Vigna unguiculata]
MLSGSMLRVCAAGVEEFVPADEPGGGGTAVFTGAKCLVLYLLALLDDVILEY